MQRPSILAEVKADLMTIGGTLYQLPSPPQANLMTIGETLYQLPSPAQDDSGVPQIAESERADKQISELSVDLKLEGELVEGVDYVVEREPDGNSSSNMTELDKKFTPYQLQYMESRKEEYITAAQQQRPNITRAVSSYFITAILKEKTLEPHERATISAHVRYWFSQRARTRRHQPKFAPAWSARTVFCKGRASDIAATQKLLYEAALEESGKSQEGGSNADIGEVDRSLVDDGAIYQPKAPVKANGKPIKLFDYFQAAVTKEMSTLTPSELEEYELRAAEWRANGPPPEEKRRLAEKDAIPFVEEFHSEMFKQMGVRLFSFIAYRRSDGKNVVAMVDVNRDTGAYQGFNEIIRVPLQKSGIFKKWAVYTTNVHTRQDDRECAPPPRGSVLPMDLNEFGEPHLPKDWMTPPEGQPQYKHYQELVRSYVTYSLAAARRSVIVNNLPKKDQQPQWAKIETWNDKLFDDDSLCVNPAAGPIKDPGSMRVKPCRLHLSHWDERQRKGLVGLVVHHYINDDGEIVESSPRTHTGRSDMDDAVEAELSKKEQQKRKRAANRKAKKEAKVKDGQEAQDKTSKRGGEAADRKSDGKTKPDATGVASRKGKRNGKQKAHVASESAPVAVDPTFEASSDRDTAVKRKQTTRNDVAPRQSSRHSRHLVIDSDEEGGEDGSSNQQISQTEPTLPPPTADRQKEAFQPYAASDDHSLFLRDSQDDDWDDAVNTQSGFDAVMPQDSLLRMSTPAPNVPPFNEMPLPLKTPTSASNPAQSVASAGGPIALNPGQGTYLSAQALPPPPSLESPPKASVVLPSGAPSIAPDFPAQQTSGASYGQHVQSLTPSRPHPFHSLSQSPYHTHSNSFYNTGPQSLYPSPSRSSGPSPSRPSYSSSPLRASHPAPLHGHSYHTPSHPSYQVPFDSSQPFFPGPSHASFSTSPYPRSHPHSYPHPSSQHYPFLQTNPTYPTPPLAPQGLYHHAASDSPVQGLGYGYSRAQPHSSPEHFALDPSGLVQPFSAALSDYNVQTQSSPLTSSDRLRTSPPHPRGGRPRAADRAEDDAAVQTPTKSKTAAGRVAMLTAGRLRSADAKSDAESDNEEDSVPPTKRRRIGDDPPVTPMKGKGKGKEKAAQRSFQNARAKSPSKKQGTKADSRAVRFRAEGVAVPEVTNKRDLALLEEARRLGADANFVRCRKPKIRQD